MTEQTTLNSPSTPDSQGTPGYGLVFKMLQTQDSLNTKVNQDWRNANFNFMDAIMVEGVELFDHMPWKWWKTHPGISEDTINKMRVEAVDIWHFILSIVLLYTEALPLEERDLSIDNLTILLNRQMDNELPGWDHGRKEELQESTRTLIGYATSPVDHVFYREDIPLWVPLVFLIGNIFHKLGMTLEDVYRLYCGKAVLNEFRWANGYGSTYIKEWFGQEDNDCMMELIKTLPVNEDFHSALEGLLKDKYTQVQMGITG